MDSGKRRRETARAARVRPGVVVVIAVFLLSIGHFLDGSGATQAADEQASGPVNAPAPPARVVTPTADAARGDVVEAAARPQRARDARLTALLRNRIDDALADAERATKGVASRKNTFVSVHVSELATDGALVEIGSDRSVRPASNLKLATTAAALVALGGDWQFSTHFEAHGALRADGVLEGDLVVRAGGDPLYDGERNGDVAHLLAPVVGELRARGVRRVTGDLVLDEGDFLEPGPGPAWPDASQHWEDYCALAAGFSANGGCLTATVTPRTAGSRASRRVRPEHAGLPLRGEVRTGTPKSRLDVRIGATTAAITVAGSIPEGVGERVYRFRHPDPVGMFGAALEAALESGGIAVDGAVRRQRGAPGGVRLATLRSPLLPLITPINTDSDNALADHVFFALGHELGGGGTRAGGARAVRAALERLGVETESLRQVDGSGLSRDNRLTARQLAALLDAVLSLDPAIAQAYLDSLAIAGRTGTLAERMRGGAAENRVRAKTGWIRGTSSLSGLAQTTSGRLLVFAILIDYPAQAGGLNTSVFKPMQDGICEVLVGWEGPGQ